MRIFGILVASALFSPLAYADCASQVCSYQCERPGRPLLDRAQSGTCLRSEANMLKRMVIAAMVSGDQSSLTCEEIARATSDGLGGEEAIFVGATCTFAEGPTGTGRNLYSKVLSDSAKTISIGASDQRICRQGNKDCVTQEGDEMRGNSTR